MSKKNRNFVSQFDEDFIEKKYQKPVEEKKSFEDEFFTPQERKKNKTKNRWEQKKAFKKKDRFDDYYDEYN